MTSLNLQVSAGIREAVCARGFGHVSADPEASRTQKKASDTQGTSKEDRHRISELLSDRHVSFLPK